MVETQSDELIDNNKLIDDYLKMYDKLGLLYSKEEGKLLKDHKEK